MLTGSKKKSGNTIPSGGNITDIGVKWGFNRMEIRFMILSTEKFLVKLSRIWDTQILDRNMKTFEFDYYNVGGLLHV